MRVLVQWTKASPEDWVELDVRNSGPFRRAWENLPAKQVPVGGETIDNTPGWIYNVNIQGVEFAGFDHYTGRPLDNGVEVTAWNDDPVDYPPGQRFAHVWTFLPLRPDPRYGGQLNTEQYLTVFDERVPSPHSGQMTSGGPVIVRPWSEFVVPSTKAIHGIWVPDTLAAAHRSVRSLRGWRDG